MVFTVTYRGKDGALCEEVVEAADRTGCVAECRKRGLAPTKIITGGKGCGTVRASHSGVAGSSKRATARWVVAAVFVAIAAGGVWCRIGSRGATDLPKEAPAKPKIEKPKSTKPPKAVEKPVITNTPVATPKIRQTEEDKRAARLKRIRDKYGDNIPDNLKAVVYFLEHPPARHFKAQGSHSYFRHPSERQIAGVVFTEPGTYFVMKPEFGDAFDRDFLNALMDKIDVNDDDSDEVRQAKEAMRDVKKEIADACKTSGKKPSEVLNEHATAMYELGLYQRNLEEELNKIHANPDLSDNDVEDFCKAANALLESKGLPQMPLPNLARRGIRLKHAQRRAEKRAAKKATEGADK